MPVPKPSMPCNHVPQGGTLLPLKPLWSTNQRFLGCRVEKCAKAFWWDGPSILAPKDPMRKRDFSNTLVELTPDHVDALKRI